MDSKRTTRTTCFTKQEIYRHLKQDPLISKRQKDPIPFLHATCLSLVLYCIESTYIKTKPSHVSLSCVVQRVHTQKQSLPFFFLLPLTYCSYIGPKILYVQLLYIYIYPSIPQTKSNSALKNICKKWCGVGQRKEAEKSKLMEWSCKFLHFFSHHY